MSIPHSFWLQESQHALGMSQSLCRLGMPAHAVDAALAAPVVLLSLAGSVPLGPEPAKYGLKALHNEGMSASPLARLTLGSAAEPDALLEWNCSHGRVAQVCHAIVHAGPRAAAAS